MRICVYESVCVVCERERESVYLLVCIDMYIHLYVCMCECTLI